MLVDCALIVIDSLSHTKKNGFLFGVLFDPWVFGLIAFVVYKALAADHRDFFQFMFCA